MAATIHWSPLASVDHSRLACIVPKNSDDILSSLRFHGSQPKEGAMVGHPAEESAGILPANEKGHLAVAS